ncbi:MAG: ribonuclease HI [Halioglobus sp.]|jgi:ribonuclease HI
MVEHEVTYVWVKGHAGIFENERCDELATLGIKSSNRIVDSEYVDRTNKGKNYGEILSEGDECRKCGTSLIKRVPKKRKVRNNNYFEYYLLCPNCNCMYMIESAKREVNK